MKWTLENSETQVDNLGWSWAELSQIGSEVEYEPKFEYRSKPEPKPKLKFDAKFKLKLSS